MKKYKPFQTFSKLRDYHIYQITILCIPQFKKNFGQCFFLLLSMILIFNLHSEKGIVYLSFFNSY